MTNDVLERIAERWRAMGPYGHDVSMEHATLDARWFAAAFAAELGVTEEMVEKVRRRDRGAAANAAEALRTLLNMGEER